MWPLAVLRKNGTGNGEHIGENLSEQEKTLLALLASPRSHDELLRSLTLQSGLATEGANALIMMLELQGYITKSNGIFIRKR